MSTSPIEPTPGIDTLQHLLNTPGVENLMSCDGTMILAGQPSLGTSPLLERSLSEAPQ